MPTRYRCADIGQNANYARYALAPQAGPKIKGAVLRRPPTIVGEIDPPMSQARYCCVVFGQNADSACSAAKPLAALKIKVAVSPMAPGQRRPGPAWPGSTLANVPSVPALRPRTHQHQKYDGPWSRWRPPKVDPNDACLKSTRPRWARADFGQDADRARSVAASPAELKI